MIEEEFQGGVPIHQRRHIAATVITIFVLGIVGVFAWRVLYFVELLRSGDLTAEDLSFVSEQSFAPNLRLFRLWKERSMWRVMMILPLVNVQPQ